MISFIALVSLWIIWMNLRSIRELIWLRGVGRFSGSEAGGAAASKAAPPARPQERVRISGADRRLLMVLTATIGLLKVAYYLACAYFLRQMFIFASYVALFFASYSTASVIDFVFEARKFLGARGHDARGELGAFIPSRSAWYLRLSTIIIEVSFSFFVIYSLYSSLLAK